jgi:hypothetical protein
MLVRDGEKAAIDTFYRNRANTYFGSGTHLFYIGLYHGSISKGSSLATIPGEPSGNGYSRQSIERSSVGWPILEQNDDLDWQLVSKEIYFEAVGGDIGPVDGYFICTSADSSGTLIGTVPFKTERTIKAGDKAIIQVQVKIT